MSLETDSLDVYENASEITFVLTRSEDVSLPAVVYFRTMDITLPEDTPLDEEAAKGWQTKILLYKYLY